MKRQIHIILIWLAMTVPLPLLASDSPFTVDSWTTEDGLPQSSVISIVQTHDGYLWLGTLNGLVRFDGNAFTSFDVNTTPGLPSDRIVYLFEDSGNTLWVGTDNAGLCAIKNGVAQKFNTGGGGNIIYACEDETGAVWFSTADGSLFCWKDGQLSRRSSNVPDQFSAELFYRAMHILVPGRNNVAWQLQGGQVMKFQANKLVKDFGPSPWKSSMAPESFKTAAGYLAVIRIDANITATCEDGDGNLVVGTRGSGVYWFNAAGGCQHISISEGLSQGFVLSLCFDHEGNLWVGTDGGGLYRIQKNYFATPSELSTGVMQSLAEDKRGGLWVQDNTRGGVMYFLTNSLHEYGFGAWSLLVDKQQQVWAGTRGEGLFRFASTNFLPVSEAAKIGSKIYALFQSRDGQLQVGGQNGLGSFDGRNWKFFTTADGLSSTAVRAIAEGTNGNLWIGTEGGGLFSLNDGKISPATNAPVKDISCLLVDHEGVLWAGTSGHGLARFAGDRWTTFAESNGLAGDDIGYLMEDDLGNLWIGSYEGLTRVAETSLAEAAADKDKKVFCRIFLSRECSAGAQPAAIRAQDGKLWFPTIQGLVAVNPADLKTDTNPPPVIIESVLVDGNQQKDNPLSSAWTQAVTLTPKNEQLEIHFTALDFSAPRRTQLAVRFKYQLDQLDGRDQAFTDIGGERVAHFNKLTPGDYYFRVIACNEDGVWNQVGARLEIIVLPPFWRQPWFVAASALIILGLLAGIIYLISTAKLKRELRALHQKELIERERARIARDLHDQLGANLTQVTLLGEMAEADKDLPAEVEQHAQQICATARETTRSLDEIVWAVNPSNDTLEGLANYACKYAQDYFALANISFRSDLPADLPATRILPEVRHNVFLAFKEAVNNVVKHAQATRARVWLRLEPEQFILGVEDNGRGLGDVSEKKLRNGLKNMRKRLDDVRGQFEIAPGPGGGTVVQLKVPITHPKP